MTKQKRSFVDTTREDASTEPVDGVKRPVVPARSNNPQSTIANPVPFKSPVKGPEEPKPHDEGAGNAVGSGGSPGGAKGGVEKPKGS